MTLDEVKAYYKTCYQFARKTGMSHANFMNWRKRGYIPLESQYKLEVMTDGALKARFEDVTTTKK